ncbi:MAG: hypothetical protein DRP45_06300 [Candidatus Zixiibacteriota bacterium]|nr:MAG: hypothetical protein DRP45_06300 [candidate division Zixibacteria bacterium]
MRTKPKQKLRLVKDRSVKLNENGVVCPEIPPDTISVLNAFPEAIILTDSKGKALFANGRARQLLNHDGKDPVGKHLTGLLTEDSRSQYRRNISEYTSVEPAGSDPQVVLCDFPGNPDENHRVEIHIGCATVKDRTLIIHVLREPTSSERYLQGFLAALDNMVYFRTLDGSLSRFCDSNARITGYSPEEIKKDPQLWRKIVHPDDLKVAREFFIAHPEGVERRTVRYRLRRKDGQWRWIHSQMVGTKDNTGRITGYNCIDRDITDSKEIEERLLSEQAALEEKNIALKQILQHIEEDKEEFRELLQQEIESTITELSMETDSGENITVAERLKRWQSKLRSTLNKHIDPFRSRFANLTSREVQICEMIERGLSSKEMAETINLSLLTIHKHRESVRKKLGIQNQNVNLSTYLRSHRLTHDT